MPHEPREKINQDIIDDDCARDSLQILPHTQHNPKNPHTLPFQRWIELGGNGTEAEARGTVDAGSGANVIDSVFWAVNENVLGPLRESRTLLRVADGKASKCIGRWEGWIWMDGVGSESVFEVFDSGGAFEVLLGKPWLTQGGAMQSFLDDSLALPSLENVLRNGYPLTEPRIQEEEKEGERRGSMGMKVEEKESKQEETKPKLEEEAQPKLEESETRVILKEPERPKVVIKEPEEPLPEKNQRKSKRLENAKQAKKGERKPYVYWIDNVPLNKLEEELEKEVGQETGLGERERTEAERGLDEALKRAEQTMERQTQAERNSWRSGNWRKVERGKEIPIEVMQLGGEQESTDHGAHLPTTPSQRRTDPFAADRIAKILAKVTIGSTLLDVDKTAVRELVTEYADVFALDLTEVLPVKTHSHKLDIPEGTKFRTRVSQRPLSQTQKDWLYPTLDDMEAADIIMRVPHDFPIAVSPTNVVPKPGGADEPSLKFLHRLANQACEEAGIPMRYPAARPEAPRPPSKAQKFRLVHNFQEVNNVTKIPAFPMGDLAAKQRNVAGHKFVNTIDFASGFNALAMEEKSVRYTGFHVEGRGHYVYRRMPFGLTGAPTSFCEMLADALHDLVGGKTEIWMDDVCMAFDSVGEGLEKTRRLLERCRERGLSLAPAKTHLFMEEAAFAGAKVLERGIQPDRRKVQAILEWPEPKSVLEVMGFLGLSGAFRSKIQNYARIAQPLSDLTRDVRAGKEKEGKARRGDYKRALKDSKVDLSGAARLAFVELKLALTSDPVLQAPKYNDKSFIVTTDGSKYGFGAMLSQRWMEKDAKGTEKEVLYPVAFASKRTSRTEENYAPFLLEFAALKFAFDSFESIIMGQEIEIETDCKALADLLGNQKLNSTHERWRESIIAHRIAAVRHRPGVENPVCDALSRQWQYRNKVEGGQGREETVDPGWEAYKGMVKDTYLLVRESGAEEVLEKFSKDEYFREILQYLVLGTVCCNPSKPLDFSSS